MNCFAGLILSLCCLFPNVIHGANIARVGNEIIGSRSGVDVPGAIFLLLDGTLPNGVLFAMRAFFRSDKKVRFQVWRPADTGNTTARYFTMVGEVKVTPSVVNRVEDIYLESVNPVSKECIRTRPGDQLGLYLEEAPGSVAYAFDTPNPMALGYTLENASVPLATNQTVLFDSPPLPYDFSLAAFVHTDLSNYPADNQSPTCPKGLLIPDDELVTPPTASPAPPPTGAPGPPGPQGLSGPPGSRGPAGAAGATGSTGEAGAAGLTGATGPRGYDGYIGATGVMGPPGIKGDQGRRGERGLAGPPGPPGGMPPVLESKSALKNPKVVMGLVVWLVIMTVVVILLVVATVLLVRRRSKEEHKEKIKTSTLDENDFKGGNNNRASIHSTHTPGWMSTMKVESYSELANSTLDRNGKTIRVKGVANGAYNNAAPPSDSSDLRLDIPADDAPESPNGSVAREE